VKRVGHHVETAGYTYGKPPLKPPGKRSKPPDKPSKLRGAHAFEACEDGSLIIYAAMPDGDGEPIRIEPHRVSAVLAACGDALAKKPSTR
jgi:hypothetical protein